MPVLRWWWCLGFFLSTSIVALTIPPLPPFIANHTFCFVIGSHHSGTTLTDLLLASHDNASALRDTHVPEDEGQHLQNVYLPAYELGGILRFPWHKDSHLTEESSLVTEQNRMSLWKSWSPFWNISKRVLVEKSPRHTTMARYLQAMFDAEHTRFVAVLRHPFGAWHWAMASHWGLVAATCGAQFIEQWLKIQDTLAADAPHLKHLAVVQFEDLANATLAQAQSMVDQMFEFVGLQASVEVSLDTSDKHELKRQTVRARYKAQYPHLFNEDGSFKRGEDVLNRLINLHLANVAQRREEKRLRNSRKENHTADPVKQDLAQPSDSQSQAALIENNQSASAEAKPDDFQQLRRSNVRARFQKEYPDLFNADGSFKRGEDVLNRLIDNHLASVDKRKLERQQERKASPTSAQIAPSTLASHSNVFANADSHELAVATELIDTASASAIQVEALINMYEQGLLPRNDGRRRLLGFWGGERSQASIHAGAAYSWVDHVLENVDMSSPVCQRMIENFEDRVNRYGYSLKDFYKRTKPVAFAKYLLEPDSNS
eukprot:TRINITY_DN26998_c0_g1_i1.p1 TRINITY_DN26998_c0_g1~~TRINITY_DN26998_c0_g1_i1.p1  ORF type:complete len:545 (+),score=87.39 TRINITY_DN26998_c0_g1_i1:79-1713(+)